MKKIAKILFWSVLFVWMIFLQPQNVMAAEADEIIKELDFTDINAQTQDLPEKMDFEKMVNKLVTEGTGGLDAGMICEYIADLFFYEITAAKPMFLQMFAIGLLFALYGKVMMTRQGYVSQMSFFIVYLGVVLLLLQSFALISEVVDQGIDRLVAFMTAFVPLYAATLFCSGNAASAGSFYQLAFGLMYLLELGMKFIFLPGVHVFVLLLLMDNLFEETKLGKMAQLFEDGIRLVLKGGLTAVMGIGVVQSLIVPARDRLSTNSIFNSISAVPGVGNTFGSAAEILLGSGILIKNSIGAAALILLFVIGMTPLLKSFCDVPPDRCIFGTGRRQPDCAVCAGRCQGMRAFLYHTAGCAAFIFYYHIHDQCFHQFHLLRREENMEVVLTFVKNYFVLMLIFYLLSYLTPKEAYQKYFHFFVSVLVITVLAQPLLVYVGGMKKEEARQQLHEIVEQMESIEYQEKGENIFEQYLGKVDQKEE